MTSVILKFLFVSKRQLKMIREEIRKKDKRRKIILKEQSVVNIY